MTKHEKLVVSAYTGTLMTSWDEFQAYAESLLERSIFSHEFGTDRLAEQLKEAVKQEFINICMRED